MAALTDRDKSFLSLLLRSPDRGNGWRSVAPSCWSLVEGFSATELVEVEPSLSGGGSVRLTDEGVIVVKYLM